MNVIMVRGMPGSGKTTFLNLIQAGLPNAVRVSLDDLMVDENMEYKWNDEHNDICVHHVKAFVASMMNQKFENILLEGFCSEHLVAPWQSFVESYGYKFTCLIAENRHGSASIREGVNPDLLTLIKSEFEVKL